MHLLQKLLIFAAMKRLLESILELMNTPWHKEQFKLGIQDTLVYGKCVYDSKGNRIPPEEWPKFEEKAITDTK